MKKIFGTILCLLFVIVACKNKVESNPKEEPKSSSANIVSMSVKKDKEIRFFTINETKAILTLPIDHTFNLTEMKPIIEVSKGAKVNPQSEAPQDFSGNKEIQYTVTAENGTTKVYTASVTVLPARQKLEVDYITICGEKVKNNKVTIAKDIAVVKKENVKIVFQGEKTPTDFAMNVEKLTLNKMGDKATVKFSTAQNDAWNAWESDEIEVTRGGSPHVPSSEKKILTFNINGREGVINETSSPKTIICFVPNGTDLSNLAPIITCSANATVSPKSGEAQNFTNSQTQPIKYTVKAEDATSEVYDVTVSFGKSDVAKIKKFVVETTGNVINNGVIDHDASTIKVKVPKGTDLTNIRPTIEVENNGTVIPASGEVQNFSNGAVEYTVTSESGQKNKKYNVSVTYKKSNEAEIKSFKILVDNQEYIAKIGTKDSPNAIVIKVPYGTPLNPVTPIIEKSDGASISPTGQQDFSDGKKVKYTVKSEDELTTNEYEAQILQYPPAKIFCKIHNEPAKKIESVMKVHLQNDKTTVEVKDLKVYHGTEASPIYIPESQLSLGIKQDPNASMTIVPKVDLHATNDTPFFIVLDMGPGFLRSALQIVVTRTPLPPTP